CARSKLYDYDGWFAYW
nr:immunoglobulin heavy chain junction region [Mus musculus]